MILVTVAMQCEAKPFIRHLGLKKVQDISVFPVYANERWKLIVSGVGKIRSAAAATFLLTRDLGNSHGFVLNAGVCGSGDTKTPAGTPILINKITDHDTGRSYFPDMVWAHPFAEGSLETWSRVLKVIGSSHQIDHLVDMEASGFFEAASRFLTPDRIAVIKVISDHFDSSRVTAGEVSMLIERCLPSVAGWVESISGSTFGKRPVFRRSEEQYMLKVSNNLRLTCTMVLELKSLARYHKLSGGNLEDLLAPYISMEPVSRKEGKIRFAHIRKKVVNP